MTPFDAAVLYSAAAAGPLMISMFSISSGLMSLKRDGRWPPTPIVFDEELLSTRMPSMIRRGSFDNEIEVEPRMRIREPPPAVAPEGSTETPGALAASTADKVDLAASVRFDVSSEAIALPFSR